jgi:SAM-dependent methyltransferase
MSDPDISDPATSDSDTSDATITDGLPERPVDPDWLALREPADVRARDAAAGTLLPPLLDHLRERLSPHGAHGPGGAVGGGGGDGAAGLRVVDLGAGTGANLRWLAPRLTELGGPGELAAQRWTLVDHDPRLETWGPAASGTIRADVGDLSRLLADLGGADLVTAAALLDVLDQPVLAAVVDAVVTSGVPCLFSLSVTGAVALDPPDPSDHPIATAFDAHQRREGRPGPDAGVEAARLFRERGWAVVVAATPWRLGPGDGELVRAWLEGRAEAAVEWRPELSGPVAGWLERRRSAAAAGALTAIVDHVDVLALPGRPARPPTSWPPA